MVSCFLLGESFDVDRHLLQFERAEAALHHVGHRDGGGKRNQHGGAVIRGVHVLEPHRRGRILEFDFSGDADAGGAHGALGGVDGGVDRHLEEQRRKQRVVDHLHLVRLDGAAGSRYADRDRHQGRALAQLAGNGGVVILRDGAHPFPGRGQFEGRVEVGQQRDDIGAGEGQRGGADGQEPVPEGPHAIAVDVGDGAIGAHAEVSGHQLDADHGAGLEIGGVAHARLDFSARGDALARLQAQRAQLRRERFQRGAAEPAEGDGGGDIHHARFAGGPRGHPGLGFGQDAREIPIGQRDGGALDRPRGGWQCRGGPHHVLDGPYAGDGIFGERKRHGHRAHQPAIDIDRAAAHARHDPGMFERPAREPRQDERFLGADVIQHAQDLDLEFVDLAARKDGPAGAAHAGLDVLQRKEAGLRGESRG